MDGQFFRVACGGVAACGGRNSYGGVAACGGGNSYGGGVACGGGDGYGGVANLLGRKKTYIHVITTSDGDPHRLSIWREVNVAAECEFESHRYATDPSTHRLEQRTLLEDGDWAVARLRG